MALGTGGPCAADVRQHAASRGGRSAYVYTGGAARAVGEARGGADGGVAVRDIRYVVIAAGEVRVRHVERLGDCAERKVGGRGRDAVSTAYAHTHREAAIAAAGGAAGRTDKYGGAKDGNTAGSRAGSSVQRQRDRDLQLRRITRAGGPVAEPQHADAAAGSCGQRHRGRGK